MKNFRTSQLLSLLVAGLCIAAPASSYADRKVKVYRDLDGDGHYNKKEYRVSGGHRHYGHGYSGYGRGYSGYGYGYRPYSYSRPYSYYRPYGYYSRPTLGVSLYSSPSYYTTERYSTYRSAPRVSYEDNLAVEVQQALKRRGYYRGSIDGDIGPASRSAIRAYQADRGISVTGRIDSSLLRSLGIG